MLGGAGPNRLERALGLVVVGAARASVNCCGCEAPDQVAVREKLQSLLTKDFGPARMGSGDGG